MDLVFEGHIENFLEDMHGRLGNLYLNWPPGSLLNLGDFGRFNGYQFEHDGNVTREFGIKFISEPGKGVDNVHTLTSKNGVAISALAKANGEVGMVDGRAGVQLDFSVQGAGFLSAAGSGDARIQAPIQLTAPLSQQVRRGKWKLGSVVITRLLVAQRGVVVVSETDSASVTLSVDIAAKELDLADAALKLTIKSISGKSYTWQGKDEVVLFGCHRLYCPKYFGDPDLKVVRLLEENQSEWDRFDDKVGTLLDDGHLTDSDFVLVEVE